MCYNQGDFFQRGQEILFQGQSFIKGAVICFSQAFVRVLGAGLRIFLAAVMGDEGIGLYQMAYPIYATCCQFPLLGIPYHSISKLVAENVAFKDHQGTEDLQYIFCHSHLLGGPVFPGFIFWGGIFCTKYC